MPANTSADETLILERVQGRILSIRGQRVIKDVDLASLYGVPTKRLNEQVKRNAERFPADFAFRLTLEEANELVANCDQFSNSKHSSQQPWVFTEHGVIRPILGLTLWAIALRATVALRSCSGLIAAAFVLNAPRAVEVSTFVVRAFVQLRRMATEIASLAQRLEAGAGAKAHLPKASPEGAAQEVRRENLELETTRRFKDQGGQLSAVFKALRDLLGHTQEPDPSPAPPKRSIGFRSQRK